MARWKDDPLVRRVFEEIQALWEESRGSDHPLLFRVEERTVPDWSELGTSGRLVNIWLLDDFGVRLAPILRRENHDFGETRGEYSRFGLVRFEVSSDRLQVALNYRLGPTVAGQIVYEVEGEGDNLQLSALSGTLSG